VTLPFQRGLRASVVAASLLLSSVLSAQDSDPLAKLDSNNRYAFDLILDSATAAGIPTGPLISKAREGIAKKVDNKRIIEVVRKLFGELRTAHNALGGVDEQELSAAAALIDAGAKPAQLELFRPRQKGRNDLTAFIIWTDFLQRGIPSEEASTAISKLWKDGVDDQTFQSLWTNVKGDISQGLNPGTALQNRIRETPGRASTTAPGKPPEGQENQSSR
jgi:hypothetical protein